VAEFLTASLIELPSQLGVDRCELVRVVAGQHDAAPDAVGGSNGDRVIGAAAAKRASLALGDDAAVSACIEKQLRIIGTRCGLVCVKKSHLRGHGGGRKEPGIGPGCCRARVPIASHEPIINDN